MSPKKTPKDDEFLRESSSAKLRKNRSEDVERSIAEH
jgi:hypothetical protein